MEKLHLEDAFPESPQTRSLVGVFERDTLKLKKYTEHLQKCCQRVVDAQTELTSSMQALSLHLSLYDKQKFPLESEDSVLSSTLKQLAKHLDQISSTEQILTTQLNDTMIYPLSKFLQADIAEISTMFEMYQMSSFEHEQSLIRFTKLRKKDGEKLLMEADEDVYGMRKKLHQTTLHYYSSLNALQYKRRCSLIEPLLGLMYSYKNVIQIGQETMCNKDSENFLANINTSIQGVHKDLGKQTQKTVSLIDKLEKDCAPYYHPLPSPDQPVSPPDNKLTQKSGYLFFRNKGSMLSGTKWDRYYFFTQGGNLMCQAKDEVAGSLILDLNEDNIFAEPADIDDRRFTFHIVSPVQKKTIVLQAENEHIRDEWIFTVNNVVQEGGYIKAKPQQEPERRTSIFGKRRSSTKDSIDSSEIEKQQASNRRRQSSLSPKSLPVQGVAQPVQGVPQVSAPGRVGQVDLMTTPIQFDMISPSQDTDDRSPKEGPPKRINPFDQSPVDIVGDNITANTATFSQSYVVRFLGSMEVKYDRGDALVFETIRQIMAARALRNVFKMRESHFLVTNESVRILDPSNSSTRSEFQLKNVSFWATHQENDRLFAFITRNVGTALADTLVNFTCHVFECNTSGQEICQAITTATQQAFKALMERRAIEQEKKIKEKEPED